MSFYGNEVSTITSFGASEDVEKVDVEQALSDFYGEDGAIGAVEAIHAIDAHFDAADRALTGAARAKDGEVVAGIEELKIAASLYGNLESFMGTVPSQESISGSPEAVIVASAEAAESIWKKAIEALKVAIAKVSNFIKKMALSAQMLFKNEKKKFEELEKKFKEGDKLDEAITISEDIANKIRGKFAALASANGNKVNAELIAEIGQLLDMKVYDAALSADITKLPEAVKQEDIEKAGEVVAQANKEEKSVKCIEAIRNTANAKSKIDYEGMGVLSFTYSTVVVLGSYVKPGTKIRALKVEKISLDSKAVKTIKVEEVAPKAFEDYVKNGIKFSEGVKEKVKEIYKVTEEIDKTFKDFATAAEKSDATAEDVTKFEELRAFRRALYKVIPSMLYNLSKGYVSFATASRELAEIYCKDVKKK